MCDNGLKHLKHATVFIKTANYRWYQTRIRKGLQVQKTKDPIITCQTSSYYLKRTNVPNIIQNVLNRHPNEVQKLYQTFLKDPKQLTEYNVSFKTGD